MPAGPARTKHLCSALAAALALTLLLAPAASAVAYKFDFRFGGVGAGPGQFSQPSGVAADPATGDIFVADTTNNRVQAFDPAGTIRPWGTPLSPLSQPAGIGVSPLGSHDVFVAD